jgi:hypothetical protein
MPHHSNHSHFHHGTSNHFGSSFGSGSPLQVMNMQMGMAAMNMNLANTFIYNGNPIGLQCRLEGLMGE